MYLAPRLLFNSSSLSIMLRQEASIARLCHKNVENYIKKNIHRKLVAHSGLLGLAELKAELLAHLGFSFL